MLIERGIARSSFCSKNLKCKQMQPHRNHATSNWNDNVKDLIISGIGWKDEDLIISGIGLERCNRMNKQYVSQNSDMQLFKS